MLRQGPQVRAGTSSGRPQSALLVPVPAAEDVVGRWRELYDPVAPAGVPAHVTLIVPWLPPAEITAGDIAELAGCVAALPAFDFTLTHVAWFGRRVLWVAPEPAREFCALINMLAERFGTPPWEDEFDEVVPHLTVAHASGDGVELATVERDVAGRLPIACRASEVWMMVGDGRRWSVEAKVPMLGRETAPAAAGVAGALSVPVHRPASGAAARHSR
jgi:2'-5' RNA ligase